MVFMFIVKLFLLDFSCLLLHNDWMILPSKEITAQSYVRDYEGLQKEVEIDIEAFWNNIASELSWFKPWNKVLDWKFPYARWFVGGQCNIVNNALDRWQKTDQKDKLAYIWVGQPFGDAQGKDGEVRTFTYGQLNEEVCRLANGLKSLGVKKGDLNQKVIGKKEGLEKDQIGESKKSVLSQYTVDLTEKAAQGVLDPVVERSEVIERTIGVPA